jgi:hypothetical protein
MTDADALAAIAAVDRLRLEAARAADALADLEAVMLGRGASPVAVSKLLGVPQSVRRWCGEQAQILSSFGVPVDGHGPRDRETGHGRGGCTTGDGHDRAGGPADRGDQVPVLAVTGTQ